MSREPSITQNTQTEKYNKGVEATPEILTRIKDLQNSHIPRYTNKQVAAILGISENIYKNIIGGKNKTITPDIINKLAQLYGCTRDYIRGESQEPNLNSNGSLMTLPLDFSEANQKITDVTSYLNNDYKTLNNLHLLLYRLPIPIRDSMLDSFNTICDHICITTLMDRKDDLTGDKFNYIIQHLNYESPELTKMTLKLAKADEHLGKKRKKNALNLYLEIIYHATYDSRSAVKNAISKVEALQEEWRNFPEELKPLSKHFSSLKKAENPHDFNLASKAENIIYEYFQSQNNDIMKREEYLTSLNY